MVSDKNRSHNMFDKITQNTNVSEGDIKSLASNVNPKDLQDEQKVRALIAQIAALAGVPVSKEKENQIVNYLVNNKLNPNDMQAMVQALMKPKK